ncbi:MAG: hypothetical protein IJ705_04015 [Oscillospiraceae bacterium]|nr:hypothetical protein [Oscillospiraceae bacterium]
MKLFGSSSGGRHSPRSGAPARQEELSVPVPVSEPEPAVTIPQPASPAPSAIPQAVASPPPAEEHPEVRVSFERIEPPPPPPVVQTAAFSSDDASDYPAPVRKKSHRFLAGYLIFLSLMIVLVAGLLALLWFRMDVYERSRPYRAMDSWMEQSDSRYWHDMLRGMGVEESYVSTLALDDVEYYKKLDAYTDEAPVYGIRFGKKTMMTATLKPGRALPFDSHVWEIGDVELVPSGLTVYAPENAVLTVYGKVAGPECLVQKDAQPVEAGPFEAQLDSFPGLSKFVLNWIFTNEGLAVTDPDGTPLDMAYSKGNAYYYSPLTYGYVIDAPSEAIVSVNGIPLTEENAEISSVPLEDFAGLEGSVSAIPADLTYVIEGLVARPTVEAAYADGTTLAPPEVTEDRWTFSRVPDEAFKTEHEAYIMQVFDAYIAFLGNRGGDMYGNLYNYQQYLVPGSEAFDRAARSLDSLYWFQGRDTALESSQLGEVLRYGADTFTAELSFTRRGTDGTEDSNTLLFIYVNYNGAWRVVRVMNKTSFLEGIT